MSTNLRWQPVVGSVLVATLSIATARAAVWDGGDGSSQNWSTASNWTGNVAPVSDPSTQLIFQGTHNTGSAANPLPQDIAATMDIDSLRIEQTTAAFHLAGGALRLNPSDPTTGIYRQGSAGSTANANTFIHNHILLNADARFTIDDDAAARVLVLAGAIDLGDHTLELALSVNSPNREFRFENTISGTGGIKLVGSNIGMGVVFRAANTFEGGLDMGFAVGRLVLGADHALGGGPLTIVNRFAHSLTVDGVASVTLGNEIVIGDDLVGNERTISFNGVFQLDGDLVLDGELAAGKRLNLATEQTVVTVNGAIREADPAQARGLRVTDGSGTMIINSQANTYTGATIVGDATKDSAVRLIVNGDISSSSGVCVDEGSTLGGSGRTSAISGGGLISPGQSPGVLTAPSVDPAQGLDFVFEFSAVGSPHYANGQASVNDVLRLTGASPFSAALGSDNVVNIYLNVTEVNRADAFRGGFYTAAMDHLAAVQNATINVYVAGDGGGSIVFNSQNYYTLEQWAPHLTEVQFRTVVEAADFSDGVVQGYVTEFTLQLPEPASAMVLALGTLVGVRRRR